MTPAKRRQIQRFAKALNSAGVQFDAAVLLVALWLRRRGLPATHDNLEIAFQGFRD